MKILTHESQPGRAANLQRSDRVSRMALTRPSASYATDLLETGVNLRQIQGWLGHRSLRTATIYTHPTQQGAEIAVLTVDRLMAGLTW